MHIYVCIIYIYIILFPPPQGPSNSAQDPNCLLAASETQQDDSLMVCFFCSPWSTIVWLLYLQDIVSLGSQIIDSIIEESQKGNGSNDSEVAQLLDQLHVDVKTESQPEEVDNAQDIPAELAAPPLEPQLAAEKPEEQQENAVMDGACALPAAAAAAAFVAEPTDSTAPSSGSQEGVQPPDITSTVGAVGVAGGDHNQGTADILDQVPFQDRQTDSNSSGPLKPPRQFTVEPDIVASTKKPPPSRPPPPSGGPPPRPPPPSWQNLPSKKSQECLRLSGLEGKNNCSS